MELATILIGATFCVMVGVIIGAAVSEHGQREREACSVRVLAYIDGSEGVTVFRSNRRHGCAVVVTEYAEPNEAVEGTLVRRVTAAYVPEVEAWDRVASTEMRAAMSPQSPQVMWVDPEWAPD